jgi:hypothetical protein
LKDTRSRRALRTAIVGRMAPGNVIVAAAGGRAVRTREQVVGIRMMVRRVEGIGYPFRLVEVRRRIRMMARGIDAVRVSDVRSPARQVVIVMVNVDVVVDFDVMLDDLRPGGGVIGIHHEVLVGNVGNGGDVAKVVIEMGHLGQVGGHRVLRGDH